MRDARRGRTEREEGSMRVSAIVEEEGRVGLGSIGG